MRIISTIHEMINAYQGWTSPFNIGLVPTMGYLHEGHLSLVHQARRENDVLVASIFVNPAQFGPREDLSTYPRDLPRDLRLLEDAGVDMVFVPTVVDPKYRSFPGVRSEMAFYTKVIRFSSESSPPW